MKVLIYTDLHVTHRHKTYMQFVSDTVDYLCEVIHEHKPDVLVNMGDTLDTFGMMDVRDAIFARRAIRKTRDHFQACGGQAYYVLRGNHDTADKHGEISSVDLLEWQGVDIISSPTVKVLPDGRNYLFVPHLRDFTNEVFEGAQSYDIRGAFAHVDWIGCRLTPSHISTSGFQPGVVGELLPEVPVFAGHYHAPMEAGPVWFVGSPLHLTFNDEVTDVPRGFTLWDTDTDEKVRLANPHTYQCWTFRCSTLPQLKKQKKAIEADIERCRVRVYVPRKLLDKAEALFEEALWCGVYPLDTEKTSMDFDTKVDLQSSPDEVVAKAVSGAPEDLDKALLAKFGRHAFSESR
jgi:hypothetical protein